MIITFMDGKDIQFFHAERGLGVWPAANEWGGLRPEIWENLFRKSERIVIV
jgi:hypothetical protein